MRQMCLLLTLLLALSGYVSAHGITGIRDVDFRNQTFPFTAHTFADLPRRVPVRNGLYHSPHQEPSLSYTYFKVAEVVFGDLTGNGRDEAAVLVIYGGASSDYYETSVYLYTMKGRRPRLIAVLNQASIGKEYERLTHDGSAYLFEAVAAGTNIVHARLIVRHFAGEAHCCPPNVFTVRYRLNKGSLLVESKSLRRRREREERLPHGWEDR
jgi:hypothetical protein